MKEYKIEISNQARDCIINNVLFLKNVDINASNTLATKIISSIESLKCFPNRFAYFNDEFISKNKYHKLYVEKYYLIIFQVTDDTVFVELVIDCRSDYKWLLATII